MTAPGPYPRPTPLRDVAQSVGAITGLIGGLVTAAVGYGILTAEQADAVTALLGLVPGLVAAATGVVAAWHTARRGEAHVTPLLSPRDSAGNRLVPVLDAEHPGRHERST